MRARSPVLPVREADWLATLIDTCRSLGYLVYHTHDSRRSAAGFPDLVAVNPFLHRVVFAELKGPGGHLSLDQQRWRDALLEAGAAWYCWRPADWPEALRVLTASCADERTESAPKAEPRTEGEAPP